MDRIKRLFAGKSLRALALRGSFWLGLGSGSEYSLRFLRNIILVRLLAPESFGLMAIVLAVNMALEAFTQVGVKEAVIQSPDGEEETYLNGAWWLSFLRSVGLFAIAIVAVPMLASFYSAGQYAGLFRFSFLAILFNGAISARALIAQKRMDFKKWIIISNGGGAIGILSAIALSFRLHSVWALVIGYVLEAAGRCILSFIMCPYLPKLRFRKEHKQALFKYARGIFGLPILYIIFRQSDIFVIGKLLPKKELGLYSMVLGLAQMPIFLVSTIINPVLMPMFSKKQHDKEWINRALLKSTKIIVLAGGPLVCFTALYGKNILTIVYGPVYAAASLPFAILLASTLLRSAGSPIANIYLAIGQPGLHRLFLIIRAAIMLLLIYPAVRFFGLAGAAAAGFLAEFVGYFFQVMRMRGLIVLDTRRYGAVYLHALGISMIVFIVWLATYHISGRPLYNLLLGLACCALAYAFMGLITFKKYRKAA